MRQLRKKDGTEIYSPNRRQKRWAEYFEKQYSHPPASGPLPGNTEPEWDVNIDCPTAEEVRHQITLLKCNKTAGPDGLQLALFKGGEELVTSLTNILRTVWHSEQVPKEWNTSIVILIFKKGARSLCENHRGISLVSVAIDQSPRKTDT